MSKKQAERLAIEAHASYIIICSRYNNNPCQFLFEVKERAANRLNRRFNLAYGK